MATQPRPRSGHNSPDFSDPAADITLVASDGIQFRIHSIILKNTSGFFKDMLTLPRSEGEDGVVPVEESSETLHTLLRMISGLPYNVPATEDKLYAVLGAAAKYDMPGPISYTKRMILPPAVPTNPIRVFHIGRRLDLSDVTEDGLRRSLDIDIHEPRHQQWLEELDNKSLLQLFKLRRVRQDTMDAFFDKLIDAPIDESDELYPEIAPQCVYCQGRNLRIASHKDEWRLLQRRVVKEFGKRPSGHAILSRAFMEWPEVKHASLGLVCSDGCDPPYATKARSIEVIVKRTEDLPYRV